MWVVAHSRLSRVSFINSQKYHFEWCHPQQVVCILDESQYLMTPFPLSTKLVPVFNDNFSCERIIEICKLQIMRNVYLT